jgi:deazaflavin-dependent oxidoreductase (nitroreductase family)
MAIKPWAARIARRANPRMRAFARRVPPFAVIEHVGRVSGRTYRTPVVAFAVRDPDSLGVLAAFPLPWGPDTDWARNVRRAGRCDLTRKGTRYTVTDPRVIPSADAARLGVVVARLMRDGQFLVGSLNAASPTTL